MYQHHFSTHPAGHCHVFVTLGNNLSRSLRENFTVQVLLSDSLRPYQAQALASKLYREPFTLK